MDQSAPARQPNYWAFLANPLVYRVEDAVRELGEETWTTKGSDVAAGDRALIWKAKGGDPVRGVVAFAEVLTDPAPMPGESAYWVHPAAGQTVEDRVRLRFLDAPNLPLWLDGPAGAVLRDLSVSRATGGTVFRVTPEQWATVIEAAGGREDAVPGDALQPARTLAGLTDPTAVSRALDEFDRIGRDAFLERYGFAPARTYFVQDGGMRYDSKAVAGAAFGYQHPSLGPLAPGEFSGGEQHVVRRLENLGFSVVRVGPAANPDWHLDEVVLALDLYVNGLGRRLPSTAADGRVVELSAILQALPIHPPELRAETFRNPDGVYLKLANFRALDPSTDRQGAGHTSRVDRLMWDEYADDPERLRAAARDVLSRYGLLGGDPSPEVSEAEDVLAALASGGRRGQGFSISPATRRAIEDEAMARAIAHYRHQGWDVEDVSRHAPYDLRCTKLGDVELRVEVKGTTGDGSAILLTANEVTHARTFPRFALFVVANLAVNETDAGVEVWGGEERVLEGWLPDEAHLRPLSFAYRLKG